MGANIKKGDRVIVTTGRDKGKKGEVLKVFPKEARALVTGINLVKRHQRQIGEACRAGSSTRKRRSICRTSPISIRKSGAATRIGIKVLGDGRKVRFAKKSGEVIDV